jgi:hypothetical protein
MDRAEGTSRSVRQILLEGDFSENLVINYAAVRTLPLLYSEIDPGSDFKDNGSIVIKVINLYYSKKTMQE